MNEDKYIICINKLIHVFLDRIHKTSKFNCLYRNYQDKQIKDMTIFDLCEMIADWIYINKE